MCKMFENIIVQDTKNMCTDEDILKIESKFNFKFPDEFKLFYLKYGSGKIKKNNVHLQSENWSTITRFHGFYNINNGIEKELENIYYEDWWYKYMIPFGYDEGGEDFCFSVDPSEYGTIYYFMSDSINESNSKEAYIKIADNLIEFINNME